MDIMDARLADRCSAPCRRSDTYGRGDLVDEVAVNVQEDGAVELLVDDVGLEDLVVEGLGRPLGNRHFGVWRGDVPPGSSSSSSSSSSRMASIGAEIGQGKKKKKEKKKEKKHEEAEREARDGGEGKKGGRKFVQSRVDDACLVPFGQVWRDVAKRNKRRSEAQGRGESGRLRPMRNVLFSDL